MPCGPERGRCLQHVVQAYQRDYSPRKGATVRISLNCCCSFTSFHLCVKALHEAGAQTEATIRIEFQMIVKSFNAVCCVAQLPSLSKTIAPYIMFDRQLAVSTVLSLFMNGVSPFTQRKLFVDVTGPFFWSGRSSSGTT